jgi:3-methyladenine DNA glycosylase AlkD
MLPEQEFFIRKAIGWVLREISQRRPELTFQFLQEHEGKPSGLTFREASRHLPAKMQQALSPPAPRGQRGRRDVIDPRRS